MDEITERMQILEMIDSGKISAEQGLHLLQALNGEDTEPEPAALEQGAALAQAEAQPLQPPESSQAAPDEWSAPLEIPEAPAPAPSQPPAALPLEAKKWRRWWMIPFGIGVAIALSGGFLMYAAFQSSGVGFWFLCAGVPFTLGVLITALALASRTSPWLHLRVQQPPGERPQRIAFSFPIPVRLTSWFLRLFGHKIPNMDATSLDEVILAVGDTVRPDNPIYIQVDEGEDGEKVEIFIG